jgi:ribonuclease HII
LSIAGASVLAKTTRDACMEQLDLEYPGYGFARHKGYGTAVHLAALNASGPTPVHRFTFAPVKAAVQELNNEEPK